MSNQINAQLAQYIERARKVIQYEQRGNHQDRVVQGGLELFVVHWADEVSNACKNAGLDLTPIHRFTEHLEGYHQQDPMQRAASLRAALATLSELESYGRDGQHMEGFPVNIKGGGPGQASIATHRDAPSKRTETHSSKAASSVAKTASTPGKTSSHTQTAPNRMKEGSQAQRVVQTAPSSNGAAQNPIHLEAGMSAGHTALTLLSADITAVPGVGPSAAAKLRSLGIRSVRDLLFYFPRQHRDYSKLTKIAQLPFNEVTTTIGLIWEVETTHGGGRRARTMATISDDTGKLKVMWFNQPYLQKQLQAAKGSYLVVTGVKQRFGNKIEFVVRSHELPEQGDLLNTGRLVPIYPLTEGLHAKTLRRFTKWAIDRYAAMVPEFLPASIRTAARLMPLPEAVSQIHYPENEDALFAARRRLAFDELFLIQLGMQERRTRWQREAPEGHAFDIDLEKIFIDTADISEVFNKREKGQRKIDEQALAGSTLWSTMATDKPFEATLPFRFTQAQRRVIIEIFGDLAQNKPMSRLLQGDVGAGKTAVAAAALLMAALNGYQGAIMAPTELLAEQHAQSISAMLEPFGIRTVLLTGSLRQRERAMGRAAIENGQAAVAIGTHALIQEDVNFSRLGLVIVDEQHRFGVEQRDALRQKGYHPHMLVMTATPIPRTLALTLYGDLDVSVIDQLPPGRQKIITRWRAGNRRDEAYKLIAQEVAEGRQAFIICPLIEESETLAVKAATVEYERLSRDVFPNLRLGLLHGGMKPNEKDMVMRQFRDGALDILVATSVIEVGIDIPNATVMVIEDADRFGLSQLHQFRGRVGRGKHQSYCYVLSADASRQAQERLEVFQMTDDGFRLAEQDLKLRGPGDFFGVRQSGVPELRMADLSDMPLIELSRSLAAKLWQSDPYLRQPEHMTLRERVRLFWQDFMAH
ncbi:MAG TPA: ATP-dependent DNA helicase RecG [Ktedonobacteraceae bacterium]|jgi:ATP-dependent DNA helicase RecG|nr:ATP-dependent DNA helicase RecG [Ktedonobacteraceae bacterium]